MNKVYVIKVTKEFDKKNVVDAVKAYMTPKSDALRMENECVGDEYIIRLMCQKNASKKGKHTNEEWIENCSVKLSFGEDVCRVSIFCQTSSATEYVGLGALAGMCYVLPIVGIPAVLYSGISAVSKGSVQVNAEKFRKDILKIVKSFVYDKDIEKENKKKEKLDRKKNVTKNEAKKKGFVCSCGNILNDDERFCPKCGKARDNGVRVCICGKEIKSDAAFCPYCGEKVE